MIMKKHLFVLAAILASATIQAQCIKPTPMTSQQLLIAAGKWQGTYTCNGVEKKTEFIISADKENLASCSVSNPPMTGKESISECFFCGGGELHVRKYIGEEAYMFQGTPENRSIKGMVPIYNA